MLGVLPFGEDPNLSGTGSLNICHPDGVKYLFLAFAIFDLYNPDAAALWQPLTPHLVEHNLLILGILQPGSQQVPS